MGEKYSGSGIYHLNTTDFISIHVKSDQRDLYEKLISEEKNENLANKLGIIQNSEDDSVSNYSDSNDEE